jgi:hypothetical protein
MEELCFSYKGKQKYHIIRRFRLNIVIVENNKY